MNHEVLGTAKTVGRIRTQLAPTMSEEASMTAQPTAPVCIVIGCDELSSLLDVTDGMFWRFEAAYCTKCYMDLQAGIRHDIDLSRLAVHFSQSMQAKSLSA
jgi:hypothetical protein